jgi:hypothetical protein
LNVWAEVHCAAVLVSSVFAVRFVGALSRRQTQRATRLARFGWLPPGLAAGA